MAEQTGVGAARGEFFRLGLEIRDVNWPPLEERSAPHGSPRDLYHLTAGQSRRNRAVVGDRPQTSLLWLEEDSIVRSAETRGAGDHCVEHGLEVRRRGTNDSQDLGGGGLLLQRLREIPVALFQLLEKAHVLDGDHGLVGERLKELDLAVRERARGRPKDGEG